MTAKTVQEVYNLILVDPFYDQIIKNILSKFSHSKDDFNDLKQNLWVYLCQMKKQKLIEAWNNKYFKYLWIKMIDNQVNSSTSSFFRKNLKQKNNKIELIEYDVDPNSKRDYLNYMENLTVDGYDEFIITKEIDNRKNYKLRLIDKALNHILESDPKMITQIIIYKMSMMEGLSYRKIQEKTKIPISTTSNYINAVEVLIKGYLKKYGHL